MSDPNRKLLCRSGGLFTRDAVFQTAEGLEADSTEHYEVIRRRVFFDDVQLVTYHHDYSVALLLTTGLIGAFFAIIGLFVLSFGKGAWAPALVFFTFGAFPGAVFLFQALFGREVITVFGRRTKAILRFSGARKRKAREVYGQICATVRKAQGARAI